jgi:hypothetical protein
MDFGHFTAFSGFGENTFEAEILDRPINVFVDDLSKISFRFLEANIKLLVQFSCLTNSHIDGVRFRQTATAKVSF